MVVGSSVSAGGWNNDYKLCQWLKDELAGLELRYYHQLHEFLLDVKHAKKVVSSRLHPLIMATGLGTNVLALSQSPKVRGLLGDLKLQTAIIDPFEQHQKTELQKYL